jgi:hypothetical protein
MIFYDRPFKAHHRRRNDALAQKAGIKERGESRIGTHEEIAPLE